MIYQYMLLFSLIEAILHRHLIDLEPEAQDLIILYLS